MVSLNEALIFVIRPGLERPIDPKQKKAPPKVPHSLESWESFLPSGQHLEASTTYSERGRVSLWTQRVLAPSAVGCLSAVWY